MNSLASQLSRPPSNLLLNSDILGILATFNAFALEKSIKQVNMKLFRSSTLLISFEIYITRLQFALQRPNIRLKDIFIDAMLEMLLWKPVTATSSYCIVQKLIEEALEARPYLMKVPSDSGLQHTETELNEVEVRRVWWQISYLTPVWDNEFLDTSITVYADVIHDDHTSSCWKDVAMRQQLIRYSSKESLAVESAFTNIDTE